MAKHTNKLSLETTDLGALEVFTSKIISEALITTSVGIFKVNAQSEIQVAVHRGTTTFVPLANSETILTVDEQVAVLRAAMDIFEKLPNQDSQKSEFQKTFVSMA